MGKRLRKIRRIRLHREGTHILVAGAVALTLLNLAVWAVCGSHHLPFHIFLGLSIAVYLLVVNFFRCPIRPFEGDTEGVIVAPADGKIVVIEEVEENEYFHAPRLMVSIFMNIVNVHANWIPCDGRVKMVRHHDGNYHCAWLPKASIENERSTVVIETPGGAEVMVRQIAGAVARRVVTYLHEGEEYEIDEHMGFIKFGSRVDVYLPLDSQILVGLGQRTTGNETILAKLK